MKRRISHRRVKIIMAAQLHSLEKQFQFEPDDYHTRKVKRIYMQCAQIHLNERIFPVHAKL
jgi:predicted pyridoxine 5'-phosphate oxidase superfamily flavin-nucleotide-binding protein